jgi:hypothetical protein
MIKALLQSAAAPLRRCEAPLREVTVVEIVRDVIDKD